MARVLVIEDEPSITMVLRIALVDEGHEVATASNGTTGLEMLSRQPYPEVVFVDLNMPGLSGRTLIEIMRDTPGLKDIPVAILSGCIPDTTHFPPKGTFNALISKPFDLRDVIETTNHLAAKGKRTNSYNTSTQTG